jgi:hypothetical protein
LKTSEQLTERWVQDQIADDPSILGLGELALKDKERIQPNAGRLDLLLQDPESLKRYEVEIQLGATDESHIIRAIEYWDVERKRYPQYEHAAVIVAEEITSRFLNVIQLFNGTIPLIAVKMTAYKVGDEYALAFVKVLDELRRGLVDDYEPVAEPTDRAFWETQRGTKRTLELTDALLQLVKEVEPNAMPNYNKHYIGLAVGGSSMNFVSFTPRRGHVIMAMRLGQSAEVDDALAEAGLDTLTYDSTWREYRIRIVGEPDDSQRSLLLRFIRQARENYGRPA